MGKGAMLVYFAMQMLIPTLLAFCITYVVARKSLRLADGALRQVGLFSASFFICAAANAISGGYITNDSFGTVGIIVVPLVVSVAVIAALGKRQKKE